MKKIVNVGAEMTKIFLTPEELECLNRIRALEGKSAITLGEESRAGLVTQLQEALYPYFESGPPAPISKGEKEAYEHPGSHGQEEPSFLEDITEPLLEQTPWYENTYLYLLPLLLLILAFYWRSGIWDWLKWLWFALVDFLQTTPGKVFLVAAIICSLVMLYYLCKGSDEEEEEIVAERTTTVPTTALTGSADRAKDLGGRPKQYFKITYKEDISEEMWLQFKARQQSTYVSGGDNAQTATLQEDSQGTH